MGLRTEPPTTTVSGRNDEREPNAKCNRADVWDWRPLSAFGGSQFPRDRTCDLGIKSLDKAGAGQCSRLKMPAILHGAMSQGNATKCRRRRQAGTPIRTPPDAGREYARGLLSILRHWKARSRLSQPHHFVTTTRTGRPLEHRRAAPLRPVMGRGRRHFALWRAAPDLHFQLRVVNPYHRVETGGERRSRRRRTTRTRSALRHEDGSSA